jgi:RHS repeat-associated protein
LAGGGSEVISKPTGGGALRGLGESFAPDLHTGAANFAVPLTVPKGRNGMAPRLKLAYTTAGGNGPFGLGWSVSLPSIARKTSKGVPRYDDALDTFILAGAEDLVAVERNAGVTRYRPRAEEMFASIEHHWGSGAGYWRVRTKNGITSLYGASFPDLPGAEPPLEPASLLARSGTSGRPFAWLIREQRDPFGNRIEYEYDADEPSDERARRWDTANGHTFNQRLPKRIRYVDFDDAGTTRFLVSITFEYEDRPDRFSDYRAGFELRRTQRCKRVVVRTHADAGLPQPVRAYEFIYLDERTDLDDLAARLPANGVSLLSRVQMVGFDANSGGTQGAAQVEMAPLDFGYTAFNPERRRFDPVAGEQLPLGALGMPEYELADLTGDGLPDVLEMNGGARYWRNLGGRLDRPRNLHAVPAGVRLGDPGVKLMDADGDGRADVLVQADGGYFPLRLAPEFDPASLRRYRALPSVQFDDPELKLLDLDGDGLTDVLRSGSRLECFFNEAELGEAWTRERRVARRVPATFPDVSFADPGVHLADMSGDGLQDIAVIRGRSVHYWPNLGLGDWGPRVVMGNAPQLPAGHDPRRVLLGDVDGDGLADLVYVDADSVTLWINQSGGRWADPIVVGGTPRLSDVDVVRLVDLPGSGVAGLLWAKGEGGLPRASLLYLDFCGGTKPYLLDSMDNNIGASTRVEYRSSTELRLEDERAAETRWRTPMPFPLQVVTRMTVVDEIAGSTQTSEYRYRNGYWDGRDREFRGFARVDVRDASTAPGSGPAAPVETRTWFHVGPVSLETGGWTELDLSHEYWQGDPPLLERPAETAALLRSLAPAERRDAVRSLKGCVVRTEQYALDDSPRRDRPYTVAETSYSVWAVVDQAGQTALLDRLPRGPTGRGPARGIFFAAQRDVRTTQWERGDDPLTALTCTSGHDRFGRPQDDVKVVLPRRSAKRLAARCAVVGAVQPDERNVLATLTRRSYAEPDTAASPELYIHDKPAHVLLFGLAESRQVTEHDPQDVRAVLVDQVAAAQAARARLEALLTGWSVGDPVPQAVELLQHVRNRYDGPAFEGRTDGKLGPFGVLTHSEELVFTDELLDAIYGTRRPDYLGGPAAAPNGAPARTAAGIGYRLMSATPSAYCDGWYANSLRAKFDSVGNMSAAKDAFGRESQITFDRFGLMPEATTDAVGLVTRATNDYRVLQPSRTTDPNGNSTCYRFTALGLLYKLWLEGSNGEGGTEARPNTRFDYHLRSWLDTRGGPSPQPIYVHVSRREHNASEGISDAVLEHREYSDGFGRLVQERVEADPLDFGDAGLPAAVGAQPTPARGTRAPGRVAVSGWSAYDEKGRVVRKYEPFYSNGWDFEFAGSLPNQLNVRIEYDALGRMTKTTMPDGTEQQIVYGIPSTLAAPSVFEPTPWESYAYDASDLDALRPGAYAAATTARAPAGHHGTPTSRLSDGLGRVIAQIERNGTDPAKDWFLTRSHYDLRGNLVDVVDALGRTAVRRRYDLRDQCLRIDSIDAGVKTTVLDAASSQVEVRDAKGSFVARDYDRLHRLVRVWARDDAPSSVTLRERLSYGDAGNPGQSATARDANRQLNRLGRVSAHWDEAGLLELERYDFMGNVAQRFRRTIGDQAVAQGTPVDWSASGASGMLESTRFQVGVRFNALGRPVEITYPLEARPRAGATQRVRPVYTLGYDASGALARVELDGQPFIEVVSYNARGQPVLCVHGNGLITRQAFDPVSFRVARVRVERATHSAGGDVWSGTGQPLQDSVYRYDPGGNVISIEERVPGCGVRGSAEGPNRLTRTFAYDAQHRLVSATGRACVSSGTPRSLQPGAACGAYAAPFTPAPPVPNQANAPDLTETYTETYKHDPLDNMLELAYAGGGGASWKRKFGMAGQAPADWSQAASNRLTSVGTGATQSTLYYDEAGNLVRQNSERRQRFDHQDRLIEHRVQQGAQPSLEARYLYASDGSRVKKWVRRNGAQVETTVYIEELFELHRWTDQGQPRLQNTLHVMGHRGRAAMLRRGDEHRDDAGPPEQYHLRDQVGSTAVVVGRAGSWINREEFFPHGDTSFGGFARKRYRFLGRERDDESGLCYMGARYYLPGIARFISCDSMLAPPPGYNLNLYAYVRGNPVSLRDPHGQQEKGYLGYKEPETSFFDWGSGWRRTKADIAEFWEEHFAPGGEDKTGPPENPKPVDAKYFLPKPPPPAPKLPEMVWRPMPTQFDKDVAEFKMAVRGVAFTMQMSFEATDALMPHAKYIMMIPGWYTKAAGYSLTEGAMLERASIDMAESVALRTAPKQIFFPDGFKAGPAFKSFEEAMAAKSHEGSHIAEVIHYDPNGKVVGHWWEVSERETGFPGRYGDTEQKALMRVALQPGETLEIRGTWASCAVGRCCDSAMQAVSIESKADIIYRYMPNNGEDTVVHYEGGIGRDDF